MPNGRNTIHEQPREQPDTKIAQLFGESEGRPDPDERIEMLVHPETRENLRTLLYQPEMEAVGYSEFLNRAIALANKQIEGWRKRQKLIEEQHGKSNS